MLELMKITRIREICETMRVDNAYALFEAAEEPKQLYIIEGAGHHPLMDVEPERFAEIFVQFFEENLPND